MRLFVNRVLAGTIASAAIACGPSTGFRTIPSDPQSCNSGRQGIIYLSWTLKGGPPTTLNCAPYSQLRLSLNSSCGFLEIEPIPCAEDHWRYDQLPEGPAVATVDALDARGNALLSGTTNLTLAASAPAMPVAVDLR
jgi:hypothetical protein